MFMIDDKCLRRLADLNQFKLPSDKVVLFGLRGALPVNPDDLSFADRQPAEVEDLSYEFPRCLLGVWDRSSKQVLIAPGSTVPFLDAVKKAQAKRGKGVNQIIPSFIHYEKGSHPRRLERDPHPAFRQSKPFAIQRSADDFDYDEDDPIRVEFPGDNLHCAFCEGPESEYRSSHGCQVVCGFAKRANRPNTKDRGAWPTYRKAAYASGQSRFRYMLIPGRSAKAAALSDPGTISMRLRFGSRGNLVELVQDKLKKAKLYDSKIDGDFGKGTLQALVDFQLRENLTTDAVVGPHVVEALGLKSKWLKG